MKILLMLTMFSITSLALGQNNPTMLTDKDYEESKSLSPQIDQLAKELDIILASNFTKKHHQSVDVATTLVISYLNNPRDANHDLLKKLCGDWDKEKFDELSSCINDEYLDKLYSEMKPEDIDPMHTQGVSIMHCDSKSLGDPKGSQYFCFNGQKVSENSKDNGANRLMMGYLCTNERLPVKNQAIVFGSCVLKDQIRTEEMSCYCQYVNGEKAKGLAWHCTDVEN